MLTQFDAVNSRGNSITFPFFGSDADYLVRRIEGLDPVIANMAFSDVAQIDGQVFQSAQRDKRNIVVTLGLAPDLSNTSVSQLRNRLYQYFMPKSEVNLKFYENGIFFVSIKGRVESFSASLFTQDPEATISILCERPDFLAADETIISGTTVSTTDELEVNYEGTTDTGFVFRLIFDQDCSEVLLYNRTPNDQINSFEVHYPFLAGDILEVSSVVGEKKVYLIRDSNETSILYASPAYSNWLVFQPEQNYFRAYLDGDPQSYTIQYRAKYGGL